MSMACVALSTGFEDSLNVPRNFAARCDPCNGESILIYLTVAGSVIPMHVSESDSIASVKLRIQTVKGVYVKKQKLVFDGRELSRNNSSVTDYGVSDGNVLHLVLKLSDLQAITVRTVCGKVFEFLVERSRNVGYVKQEIAKKGSGFLDLEDQELICDGDELEDKSIIHDICKHNDSVLHLLVRKSAKVRANPVENDFELLIVASDLGEKELHFASQTRFSMGIFIEPLIINPKIELPLGIKKLINSTFYGLRRDNRPIRSAEGSGGAYLMLDAFGEKYVSVFKPIDEEPMALYNPRGLPLSTDGEGLKKGTRVGEGALREVAAFILDHPKCGPRLPYHEEAEKGFAGVPPTVMVKCLDEGFNHPDGFKYTSKCVKIGSLQMFVQNNGSCEDVGPRDFPVDEVHKISVLDIRLANADRHAGNILMGKDSEDGRIVLIPIDHGYCLPENFEDCTFDWLNWPQAKQPYSVDTINYIKSLDAEQDIELLKFHGWDLPLECTRTLHIGTMLLKKGAERGLTAYAIGSIMCRQTLKKESMVEQIVREAQESVLPESSEAAFLESVSLIMDHYLDELSTSPRSKF